MKLQTLWNICCGTMVAAASVCFGGWDMWLKVLLAVIVLDYITGIMGAFVMGTLDSRVGFKGICKKLMILFIVALACWMDGLITANGGIRALAMGFYVANDALSVIENAAVLGVPVPKGLVDKLEQLKDDNSGGKNS